MSICKGTESFGTLPEKVEYNRQHEYLTESREKEDVAYLAQLKKEYDFIPAPASAFENGFQQKLLPVSTFAKIASAKMLLMSTFEKINMMLS